MYLKNLVDSMPRILQDIIRGEGTPPSTSDMKHTHKEPFFMAIIIRNTELVNLARYSICVVSF
jgi:hypothetical protein